MVAALKVAGHGTIIWRLLVLVVIVSRLSRFWQVFFSSDAIRPCHWRVNNSAIRVVRPCHWRINNSAFQQWQGRGASELKKTCPILKSQNLQNTKSLRLLLFCVVVLCCLLDCYIVFLLFLLFVYCFYIYTHIYTYTCIYIHILMGRSIGKIICSRNRSWMHPGTLHLLLPFSSIVDSI